MVLEQLLKERWVEKRPLFALIVGFVYTFVGAGTAFIFFGRNISVAMLFLASLLIVPNLNMLFDVEEKRERKEGLKHFFRNHRDVFEACLFLFLGIFIGYLALGIGANASGMDFSEIFSYQLNFLENQQGLSGEVIGDFLESPFRADAGQFLAISTKNLETALIFFMLSFFYGAGAIFLIILNASIFSTFLIYIVDTLAKSMSQVPSLLGIFSIHLVPEVSGFLLAAIAGAMVSKALIKEKLGCNCFRNVFKDATVLLAVSFLVIMVAAFLEVYVSASLFHSFL
ncbi:hypothetical protein GF351_03125 [Candidatus Woesearchaeota archaeon]|nr:hypothetical protein [Candidatus Woesearchaeota archaeon]